MFRMEPLDHATIDAYSEARFSELTVNERYVKYERFLILFGIIFGILSSLLLCVF